mmetsp:Transcript_19707/g.30955  ORF Transcript_19707/g.30955 Transcript_19707/m.30955 type:complete len:203 (+) Transcript_19707:996-1604(+)
MKPHCTIPIASSRNHSIPGSRHGCPIKLPLALHIPPGNSSLDSSLFSIPSSPPPLSSSPSPSITIGVEFVNRTSRLADSNNPDFTTMCPSTVTVGCPIQNRKSNTSDSSSVAEIFVRVASRSSAKYLAFQKLLLLVSLSLAVEFFDAESGSSTCSDDGDGSIRRCCSIRCCSIRGRSTTPLSSTTSTTSTPLSPSETTTNEE